MEKDKTPNQNAGIYEQANPKNDEKYMPGTGILLYSHELTFTGAPNSLLRIAKILKSAEYQVEIWAPEDGGFRAEFEKYGFVVRIVPYEELTDPEWIQRIGSFDLAIANTVVSHRFYDVAHRIIPTIWYIREAQNLPEFCDRVSLRKELLSMSPDLYCVSEYAQEFIRKTYNPDVTVLHNCMEDYYEGPSGSQSGKVNFIAVGSFNKRKAFDVCYDAFSSLPTAVQEKAHFYFAGRLKEGNQNYWRDLVDKINKNPNTTYLGEITDTAEKISTFKKMDVFVVASRDESCSLVVLEGAMLGKPLIVSENVGAKYMVDDSNGWVVKTGDADSLRETLAQIIRSPEQLTQMGEISRKKYLETSTIRIYEKNILDMVDKKLRETKNGFSLRNGVGAIQYKLAAERAERENKALRNEIAALRASWSYRIGHLIVWFPGKIKRGIRCCREHGLKYTMYRVFVHLHLAKEDSPHAPISKTLLPPRKK